MAEYAEDLSRPSADLPDFFPAIVENNTVDGRLIGVPYFTDAGLLYYRTDLLTRSMATAARRPPGPSSRRCPQKIQEGERAAMPDFWGFVWQGKPTRA